MTYQDSTIITQRFDNDEYQIKGKIGQGGFGQVYKAFKPKTGQWVAIKFLLLDSELTPFKRSQNIRRFERETHLSSRLEHPNIVRLLDKGRCDNDLLYTVFEYVEGQTLKQYIEQQGTLSANDTANIMLQVLDALAHAHDRGVIHRDIKPSNIMIINHGTKIHAKVLDFGIGTFIDSANQLENETLTLSRETLGTPSYSAPEQLRGEPVTSNTDLYVWGLVFLECLTGEPAIKGNSLASIFHQQLTPADIPLPASVIGHPLATPLRQVLAKKSRDRISDAHTLYNRLNAINFTTLVGNLNQSPVCRQSQSVTIDVQQNVQNNIHKYGQNHFQNDDQTTQTLDDITLLTQQNYSYSQLTQRKQIVALSVQVNINPNHDDVDSEVVDTLQQDQKSLIQDIAGRYGAFNAGSLADTLLFYFGYPNSTDNDSRLAARTALDINSDVINRSSALDASKDVTVTVNCGLSLGMVTVFAEQIPEGQSINIAMNLARQAKSGQILCNRSAFESLNTYYQLNQQEQNTNTYSLEAERQTEALGFLRTNTRGAFVGRGNLVKQILEQLQSDEQNVIHIYGQAGIGKSRLVLEIKQRTKQQTTQQEKRQYQHLIAQCLPEHQNDALYPLVNLIKQHHRLSDAEPSIIEQRLTSALGKHATVTNIALLSAWMSLPISSEQTIHSLSPAEQKQIIQRCFTELLNPNDSQECKILFIEDLHWADSMTQEFIGKLQNQPNNCGHRLKIITTSRQAFASEQINVLPILLDKLNHQDSGEFVAQLFNLQQLSLRLIDFIIERADGIPLFIESLVQMLNQNKLLARINGLLDFVNPDNKEQIPNNLRDTLQQQLDSLTYSKDTAQLAATIGRQFSLNLLQQVSLKSPSQLHSDIQELIATNIIFEQRKITGSAYLFKHALIRDTAYESMTGASRMATHQALAQSIEDSPQKDQELATIARHYQGAEQYQRAGDYWQQSAEQAVQKGQSAQGVPYFNSAITNLAKLPQNQALYSQQISVRSALGIALSATKGYASAAVKENQQLISEIINKLEKPSDTFMVLWPNCVTNVVLANYPTADKLANELIEMAETHPQPELIFPAYLMRMAVDWQTGQFTQAAAIGNKALEIYDFAQHNHLTTTFTYDPGIAIMIVQAMVVWSLGEQQQAQQLCERALTLSQTCGDPGNMAHTLTRYYQVAVYRKDYQQALTLSQQTHTLAKTHSMELWRCCALTVELWAKCAEQQNCSHLLDQIEQAYQDQLKTGAKAITSFYLTLYAEACYNQQALTRGFEAINQAIEKAEKYNDTLYLVESYRVKLDILAQLTIDEATDKTTDKATDETADKGIREQLNITLDKAISLINKQNAQGFMPNLIQNIKQLPLDEGQKQAYIETLNTN